MLKTLGTVVIIFDDQVFLEGEYTKWPAILCVRSWPTRREEICVLKGPVS